MKGLRAATFALVLIYWAVAVFAFLGALIFLGLAAFTGFTL